MEIATLGFRMHKIWQILKPFCRVISSSKNILFLKSDNNSVLYLVPQEIKVAQGHLLAVEREIGKSRRLYHQDQAVTA